MLALGYISSRVLSSVILRLSLLMEKIPKCRMTIYPSLTLGNEKLQLGVYK
jgi:hypothetical protein